MILADTSVWIDHLRWPDARLVAALEGDQVVIHQFVIGELACGHLRNRRALIELWVDLPFAPTATEVQALAFIERHALMGTGLGYIDVHLLASASLAESTTVWTKDRKLAAAATTLDLVHDDSR